MVFDAGRLQGRVDFASAAVRHNERHSRAPDPLDGRNDSTEASSSFDELAAELDDDGSESGAHSNPVVSSMPSMTLKFCTAWPDAPFRRLSMTETRIARPDPSTRQPMSQKLVFATCLISGNDDPT